MLPGLDAMPLKREFKRLMLRSLPPFMAEFLESATDEDARNSLGLGAGADIASAATLDLTGRTGNVVRITGTTPTDTITLETGAVVFCIAAAAWPLTYHATTNPVQGGRDYVCQPGEIVAFMKDGDDVLHNFILSAAYGASGRNKIINGAMAVDQRNSGAAQTITAAAALAYTVDRWYGYCTGANVTGQRVAGSVQDQYRYQFTGAASVTAIGFGQRIEKANCIDLADGTATLSVDLANSLLTSVTWTAYYANTDDTFGTLASPTRTQIATGTFTVSSTVARYTAQIAIPAAATTGIEIVFSVGAQTSGTWTIGNAQLEPGALASFFERRSVNEETALCQRYYWKHMGALASFGAGFSSSATTAVISVNFPVAMRASPTFTQVGVYVLNAANNYAVSEISSSSSGATSARVQFTTSSMTSGQGVIAYPFGATDYFAASSEL